MNTPTPEKPYGAPIRFFFALIAYAIIGILGICYAVYFIWKMLTASPKPQRKNVGDIPWG